MHGRDKRTERSGDGEHRTEPASHEHFEPDDDTLDDDTLDDASFRATRSLYLTFTALTPSPRAL